MNERDEKRALLLFLGVIGGVFAYSYWERYLAAKQKPIEDGTAAARRAYEQINDPAWKAAHDDESAPATRPTTAPRLRGLLP